MTFFKKVFLPDESVDLADLDVVKFLHSTLDLVLVGLDVRDEDEGVVVFDLLHRGLGRQRVLYDVVSVHTARIGTFLVSFCV